MHFQTGCWNLELPNKEPLAMTYGRLILLVRKVEVGGRSNAHWAWDFRLSQKWIIKVLLSGMYLHFAETCRLHLLDMSKMKAVVFFSDSLVQYLQNKIHGVVPTKTIIITVSNLCHRETAVAQRLRCCVTNRKIAVSIPAGVSRIFHWHKILSIVLWNWGRLSL